MRVPVPGSMGTDPKRWKKLEGQLNGEAGNAGMAPLWGPWLAIPQPQLQDKAAWPGDSMEIMTET